MMDMDISVIVPTYNRADLIAETLESILGQSYQPAEVIVVDDGSQDGTEEVARRFGSSITYIRIENSGECRARNVGAASATGEWIAFCDSDDIWHADKLLLQARLSHDNPEVEYSFTNFKTIVDGHWSAATKFDSSPPGYWDLRRRQSGQDTFVVLEPIFDRLLYHQPIFPSSLMMKRSFFEASGKWNEVLGRTPSVDLEYHLRCVNHSAIGVVAAPVVGIRKHASNFSGDPLKTAIGEIEILRYVLQHNPEAWRYRDAISEQIIVRSGRAAEAAFAACTPCLAYQLLEAVPRRSRSLKLQLEALAWRFPKPLTMALQRGAVALRQNVRTSRSTAPRTV